jgi:hypothetical protein
MNPDRPALYLGRAGQLVHSQAPRSLGIPARPRRNRPPTAAEGHLRMG